MGGTVELEFKRPYKFQVAVQRKILGNFGTELLRTQVYMNQDLFETLKVNSLFEKLPETLQELWNSTMLAPTEAMDIGVVTTEEVLQEIAVVKAP